MRCLLLIVLLAVAQTSLPVPQKPPNSAASAGQDLKKDSSDSKTPIASPSTVFRPVAPNPEQNASNTPKRENEQQPVEISKLPPVSVTPGWRDDASLVFSLILVAVTAIQAYLLCRTLTAVGIQAVIMRRQTGQIARQARSMRYQTTILRKSVVAAEENAKAARVSANALINSERAWILVDIGKLPPFDPDPNLVQFLWIFPTIKNYGKTVARIKRVAGIVKLIPEGQKLPVVPEYILGQGFDQQIDTVLPPEVPMQPRSA